MNYNDIPILMYHDIGEIDSPWCVSPQEFEWQMRFLKEQGYRTISLEELKGGVEEGKECSEKLIVITFDDARKGVFTYARPLLWQLGFTATVFVVPAWIYGKDIPEQEGYSSFMTWEELKTLMSEGFEVGSHTYSHRPLSALSVDDVQKEFAEAETALSEQLNLAVQHFSYPYGHYNAQVLDEVKKRYTTAVTIERGFSKKEGEYARQWIVRETSREQFQKLLCIPTLSLAMIVKNEEQFLGECLSSVQGLVDEMVVVDTGSTDETKEVALSYGAKVSDFVWNDDFAIARNFALEKATGNWVLVLDADEVLSAADAGVIRDVLHRWEVSGFRILTRNYSNDSSITGWRPCVQGEDVFTKGFRGWCPSLKVRLFQRGKGLFQGRVHEMLDEKQLLRHGAVESLPISVHHYGALRGDHKSDYYKFLTFRKILEQPGDGHAYFELGIQHKQLGEFSLAEEAFRQSLALEPDQVLPLLNLAIVLHKQQKLADAIEKYLKVVKQGKLLGEAYFGLGYCYFKLEEVAKARDCFIKTLEHDPLHVEAYVNVGAACEKLQKYTEAVSFLTKALQLHPQHPRAYYNLGVVYEQEMKISSAVVCYKKAVELGYKKKELEEKVPKMERFLQESRL